MQKCELCQQYKRSVFRRADHGKTLCGECDLELLRKISPTRVMRVLRKKIN